MIWRFRFLLFPTAAFVLIASLAWGEWSKVIRVKRAAEEFHRGSRIRVFRDMGMRTWQGKSVPSYEYEQDGRTREFATHARMDLPPDGRVRIGLDPIPRSSSPHSESIRDEIAIPMNGPDTVEAIYKVFRGHEIGEDITKASVVSGAALIAGVAGFYLQRRIFRDVRRTIRGR